MRTGSVNDEVRTRSFDLGAGGSSAGNLRPQGPKPSLGFEGLFAADAAGVAPPPCDHGPELHADAGLAPDERYFTTTEIGAWIDDLVKAHPGKAKKLDLSALPGAAKTHRGQSMVGIELGGNVADSDKPAILLIAQHHARELNSAVMALYPIKRMLEAYGQDAAITKLLDTHRVVIVPSVNPDGVDRVWGGQPMWRKNARDNGDGTQGVDLNRNYPFGWGSCGSSTQGASETYRGPSAGSEPETRTMMALQHWLRPELYLDVHSSGQEVLNLYADCVEARPAIVALGAHYQNELAAKLDFGTRPPSGSGEAPHYHWSQGSLSLLIEVGSSFQPPFAETVQEEARVWPGLLHAMSTWAPAARGHVRSSDGGAVEAEISVIDLFANGERSYTRGADGRFGLWLPLGEHQVTFSAPGHESVTRTVRVESYDQPVALEVTLKKRARETPLLSASERVQLRRAA